MDKPSTPVTSLSERRRDKNRQVTQEGKTDRVRILELEVETAKLLEVLVDMQDRLDAQERHLRKLISSLLRSKDKS